LKLVLKQAVASIPDYCLVGLMTFGEFVSLHQLSSEMPTCVVFRGTDNLTRAEVRAAANLSIPFCSNPLRLGSTILFSPWEIPPKP
jgi:hypothetical protein